MIWIILRCMGISSLIFEQVRRPPCCPVVSIIIINRECLSAPLSPTFSLFRAATDQSIWKNSSSHCGYCHLHLQENFNYFGNSFAHLVLFIETTLPGACCLPWGRKYLRNTYVRGANVRLLGNKTVYLLRGRRAPQTGSFYLLQRESLIDQMNGLTKISPIGTYFIAVLIGVGSG